MPQVLVWKCSKTGKLFEDKDKFRSHLAKLAAEARIRLKIDRENTEASVWWDEFRNRERSVEDLMQEIIDNQDKFWAEAAKNNAYDWEKVGRMKRKGVTMPVPKLLEIKLESVHFTDSASNSHHKPHDGVTNWGGKVTLPDGSPAPRGYPGITAHIHWYVEWPEEFNGWYQGGDLFDFPRSRIHTGSGSGGHVDKLGRQCFQYGFTLFLQDWPGVAAYYEKQRLIKILSS